MNKASNRKSLCWPKFRAEQLSQNYWDAGEDLGRIKVVIAEGYAQTLRDSPFIRTKNLVTFSFQHAPQCEWDAGKHQVQTY